MKRSAALTVMAILAVIFSSACAFGAVKDFGSFKVNVPKGWKAEKDGTTVTLTKKNMMMLIDIDSRDGRSLEEVAREFAKEFNSSDLEDIEDYYIFTFNNDNGFGRVSSVKGGKYLLVIMTGNRDGEMADIDDSIRVK